MGATPEEAFFVKCDEETNPQESIDLGQLVTVIGVAPVKPAEFIIFRSGKTPAKHRSKRSNKLNCKERFHASC